MSRRKKETGGRLNPPNVLVPWLATGMGLIALTASTDLSSTEPAYAFSPTERAAVASPSIGSSLQRMANAPARLVLTSLPAPSPSAVSALSSRSLTPTPTHPSPVDRLFQVNGEPVRPLPRTAEAIDQVGQETVPMEQRWAQLRHCEATSDYAATNDSGKFRGAYQFDVDTWESVGGVGDPANANSIEQDKRARILFERRGSSPWPECGHYLDQ